MANFMLNLLLNSIILGVIFLIVLMMTPFFKKYSRRWRYVVLIIIGIKLLIPFSITTDTFAKNIPFLQKSDSVKEINQREKQSYVKEEKFDSSWNYVPDESEKGEKKEETSKNAEQISEIEQDEKSTQNNVAISQNIEGTVWTWENIKTKYFDIDYEQMLQVAFVTWGIVAALFLAGYLFLYQYHKKRIRRFRAPVEDEKLLQIFREEKEQLGINRNIGFFQCQRINTPMAVGILNTSILIPYMENYEGVRYILKHELVHQKKRDMWVKVFYVIVKSIHWFNPLVHFMVKTAYDDIEILCDDEVVKTLKKEQRIEYNESILNIVKAQYKYEETEKIVFSFGIIQGENDLKERMLNIMNMNSKKHGYIIALCICVIMLLSNSMVLSVTGDNRESGYTKSNMVFMKSKGYRQVRAALERKKENAIYERKVEMVVAFNEDSHSDPLYDFIHAVLLTIKSKNISYSEQKEQFLWESVIEWVNIAGNDQGSWLDVKKYDDQFYSINERSVEEFARALYGKTIYPQKIPSNLKVLYNQEKKVYLIPFQEVDSGHFQDGYTEYDDVAHSLTADYYWEEDLSGLYGEDDVSSVHEEEPYVYYITFIMDDSSALGWEVTNVKKELKQIETNTEEETTAKRVIEIVTDETVQQILSSDKLEKIKLSVLENDELTPLVRGLVDAKAYPVSKDMSEEEFNNFTIAYALNFMNSYGKLSGEDTTYVEGEDVWSVNSEIIEELGCVVTGKKVTEKNMPKGEMVSYNPSDGRYRVFVGEPGAVSFTIGNVEATENGILIEGDSRTYDDTVRYEYSIRLKYNPNNIYGFSVEDVILID